MKMIPPAEIEAIATKVAQANLTPQVVERVVSEPTVDSEGTDALLVTIVVSANSVDGLDGDAILSTLVGIQQGLQAAGEERYAILTYTTEDELAHAGDQP